MVGTAASWKVEVQISGQVLLLRKAFHKQNQLDQRPSLTVQINLQHLSSHAYWDLACDPNYCNIAILLATAATLM